MRLRLQGQEVRHWLHCFFSSFVIKTENLPFLFCLLICHLSSILYYYNTSNACICSVYVHACCCACVLGGGGGMEVQILYSCVCDESTHQKALVSAPGRWGTTN